jgi:hypothetical protein
MTMTPATSDAMRMHYRHRHRHPATGVPGGGAEEEEAEEAKEEMIDAVVLYITVSNSHYYPIS